MLRPLSLPTERPSPTTTVPLTGRAVARHRAALRLRPLRSEWDRDQSWPDAAVSLVHLLVAVSRCLEIPGQDVRWLLGEEGWSFVVESQDLEIHRRGDDAAERGRRAARIRRAAEGASSVAAIARSVGCSRTTVDRALEAEPESPPDARTANPGRPRSSDDAVLQAVRAAREARPGAGPRLLHALLLRHPAGVGLEPADVPSAARIGQLVNGWGLARQPVGPRDQRRFPDAHPTEPGCVTVDRWGTAWKHSRLRGPGAEAVP